MQPPSSLTNTVFLLFDLHFIHLGTFFYVMIVGPSFTLKLHTWQSSNPHIPNDCDTTTVSTCVFKRIFSGRASKAGGELHMLICTSHHPRAHISRRRACFVYFYSHAPHLLHSHHTGFHRGVHSPFSPKVSHQSVCVSGHISCTGSTSFWRGCQVGRWRKITTSQFINFFFKLLLLFK